MKQNRQNFIYHVLGKIYVELLESELEIFSRETCPGCTSDEEYHLCTANKTEKIYHFMENAVINETQVDRLALDNVNSLNLWRTEGCEKLFDRVWRSSQASDPNFWLLLIELYRPFVIEG